MDKLSLDSRTNRRIRLDDIMGYDVLIPPDIMQKGVAKVKDGILISIRPSGITMEFIPPVVMISEE